MQISEILDRINTAKSKAFRTDKIFFVGVSKNHSVDEIKFAENYIDFFGENRVQEAQNKILNYGPCKVSWRLIGHLQQNKARKAMEIFSSIDSLDSIELANKLNNLAIEFNKIMPVLIEVNTSGEINKSGITPENFYKLLDHVITLENLKLNGLMTVGPLTDDDTKIHKSFELLRNLTEQARIKTGLELPIISMGMSDDFETAIYEGSTMIRIGTLLFGERDYKK